MYNKKLFVLLFLILTTILCSSVEATNSSEVISYSDYFYSSVTTGVSSAKTEQSYVLGMRVPNIENWQHITWVEFKETGETKDRIDIINPDAEFSAYIGGVYVGRGIAIAKSESGTNLKDSITFYFTDWNIGTRTGNKLVTFTMSRNIARSDWYSYGINDHGTEGYLTSPYLALESSAIEYAAIPGGIHQVACYNEYFSVLTLNQTNYQGNASVYTLSQVSLNRYYDGKNYGAALDVRSQDGKYIYINNQYATSGTTSTTVDYYPTIVKVSFGEPSVLYETTRILTGSGFVTPTPTPTQTTSPTPTQTPVPQLCPYWSLSLNTSNIIRNEAVLGTLTETDPQDRFDMIDWYRVLPNGQEVLYKHYVYDSGFFGLGAGWFLVDTDTGQATSSSLSAAMVNTIQFTTGGTNYVKVKIYDDLSPLPLIYHDYNLVCSPSQVVYVGDTTQAMTQQGINVYEADTNALLSGVSIAVRDLATGEWQNKTSVYGETTYFSAVPGHSMRVIASKTGWLTSDTTMTVANPPVPYAVYLKRPLPEIENKSYAFFYVRDSQTNIALFQATIQLSDGQLQSTLPSGYAGFNVNDGQTYYYTVSKPGYQSYTGTFNINQDTTFQVKLVQIAPTPTYTLPSTMPTVTVQTTSVTGTPTGTVTGTVTGTPGTTSTATLSPIDRTQRATRAADVWYNHAEAISNLLVLAAIVGILGLMSTAMDRRRRRR